MGRIWINSTTENKGSFVTCSELDELVENYTVYSKEFETPKGNKVLKYFFRAK